MKTDPEMKSDVADWHELRRSPVTRLGSGHRNGEWGSFQATRVIREGKQTEVQEGGFIDEWRETKA